MRTKLITYTLRVVWTDTRGRTKSRTMRGLFLHDAEAIARVLNNEPTTISCTFRRDES